MKRCATNASRAITLTQANIRNAHFYLTGLEDFFPSDVFGSSARSKGIGRELRLDVVGLESAICTDIPRYGANGRSRGFFRRRGWIRRFFSIHELRAGDRVVMRRLQPYRYSVEPAPAGRNGDALLPFRVGIRETSRTRARRVPFTFADLFAGIGGMRLGLQAVGGRCVFSCEWDKNCQKTYEAWFGEKPAGDIREIRTDDFPCPDILAAGFPCQPFSIAGVTKKNALGRPHGFKDESQGTLFFVLAGIIETKRPPILLLENVKNLKSHDRGNTWRVIYSTLEELGYRLFDRVIDAAAWVPQHRERIFIVGFDRRVFGDDPPFRFSTAADAPHPLFRSILERRPHPKYTLTDHLWGYLQEYARKHRARGNGFGFGMTDVNGISRTLSARYYKDGSEILIPQAPRKNPRRLTPREAARLMGFPDRLPIVVSDTQAYRQFGNAVVPAPVEQIGRQIIRVLSESPRAWRSRKTRNTTCH